MIAGPFAGAKAAKAAVKRLKVDLELEGHIISPGSDRTAKSFAEPRAGKTLFQNTNAPKSDATSASDAMTSEASKRGVTATEGRMFRKMPPEVPSGNPLEFPPEIDKRGAVPGPIEPK